MVGPGVRHKECISYFGPASKGRRKGAPLNCCVGRMMLATGLAGALVVGMAPLRAQRDQGREGRIQISGRVQLGSGRAVRSI